MSAACLTRPQYVLRSYLEAGNSRLPGNEADIDSSCGVDDPLLYYLQTAESEAELTHLFNKVVSSPEDGFRAFVCILCFD